MNESLKSETERLASSWMQHEPAWLRDYLVSDVEDPRINLQSIFSRHFLIRALFGERFISVMEHEYRFSALMNWLLVLARQVSETEELAAVLHALRRGADNAEGISIPQCALQTFASLPASLGEWKVPNYIESFLGRTRIADGAAIIDQVSKNTFQDVWNQVLASQPDVLHSPSLFEPGCGSANDYRFLHSYGIAQFFDYTGLDLCIKNIENARALYPGARFEPGNVFEIAAADQVFDFCFVHDLFEHLSSEGLAVAIGEICRVTRRGICVGFFSMAEAAEHIVRPVEEYHWNTLSLSLVKELFARHGFTARVVHIESFLRQHIGISETHNPNAYTLLLWRPV